MRLPACAIAILLVLATAAPLTAAPRTSAQVEALTERVLRQAILIDTHADTPQFLLDSGYDLADPSSPYQISIPKARRGHLGAEFFSIWVPVDWPRQDLAHRALDLMDAVDAQVARHRSDLGLARTAEDVVRLHGEGKIAVLMGVEGGHILEADPRLLDTFYRLGVRYLTLTHTADNEIGDSSGDKPRWNGLSPLGLQVVERMNRLGMMVDISHVSDATFYAAVQASKAPVIASHSSCRALCDAPRDMTDDMIRALAKNGGVMDINFYPAFLDAGYRQASAKISKEENAAVDAVRKRLAGEGKQLSWAEEIKIRHPFEARLAPVSYTRIADHIDHAVQVAGMDHVGLGSDFDGIESWPKGMEDCSKLPNLVRELVRRGYSEQDLIKILGGNVLRVMRQVEQVARQMQAPGGGNE